jgi:ribose transport system ATP-binding protein
VRGAAGSAAPRATRPRARKQMATHISTDTKPVLSLRDITKSFPGVKALKDVSLDLFPGEVHALLGENGAGKSTLMGVAAGSLRADSGTVELGGEPLAAGAPLDAQERGIAIVRQEPALLGDLTVAENMTLALPAEVRNSGGHSQAWMSAALEQIGCDIDLGARIEDLSMANRQLIELAKALASEPRVLICDEPTAPLGVDMVGRVFEQVRAAASRGAAVVYISHRLAEVRSICDRVTVMRDGQVQGSAPIDEMSDEEMLRMTKPERSLPPSPSATSLATTSRMWT